MIAPGAELKIYIATRPVDFRCGHDGLAAKVQEMLGLDPFSGAAFVFRSKRADRIKILVWDRTGLDCGFSSLSQLAKPERRERRAVAHAELGVDRLDVEMRGVRTLVELLRDVLFRVPVEQCEQHPAFSRCQGGVGDEQTMAEQLLPVKPSQGAHHETQTLSVLRREAR